MQANKLPDAFALVAKMMNQTGLWDAESVWYFPSATRWICLYGFGHRSESTVLGLSDLVWSSRLLQSERNFFNHLATVLWSTTPSPFVQLIFLSFFRCLMTHLDLVKYKFLNFTRSSMHLSNPTLGEAMHNVLGPQLPRYFHPQRVPITAWTALLT